MKHLILLIFLSGSLQAQVLIDSSRNDSPTQRAYLLQHNSNDKDTIIKDTLRRIIYCMTKASEMMYLEHKQYKIGVLMLGFGTIGTFTFGYLGTQDAINRETNFGVAAVCSLMSIAGSIIMIDSHKYTKKAGYYLKQAGGDFTIGINF